MKVERIKLYLESDRYVFGWKRTDAHGFVEVSFDGMHYHRILRIW